MAYKNIILDDSILDVDSWFPQEAIDEIVEIIKTHANTSIDNHSQMSKGYKLDSFYKNTYKESAIRRKEYLSDIPKFVDYQLAGGQVA
ncbi:hypothetical protein PIG81_01525 [Streptococcus thermophilus]|jgi:hypothetical protein|uniref:hypothetical protein n=1 Tax=Streptococcus TaxID=1301 RepID=UPI00066C7625|nr:MULTISPECIES: hypothetical protein [Streptococcus]MDA5519472.1 hypothetical protein [Streptococcus thermophilus]MDU5787973.1 hypothetical protein [Streptococcus parasanguinis]MDW2956809.1 hypothetical protein [Streptococcus thermophilus]